MTRVFSILDDYVLNGRATLNLADDDCPECQGVGEIEGEAVNRNGPYSVLMTCPTCKGSGKVEVDPYEGDE